MRRRTSVCAAVFIAGFLTTLYAQQDQYRIRDVSYEIDGITRVYALSKNIPVDTDTVFETKKQFDSYISDLRLQFANERIFKHSEIICTEGSAGDGGIIPVDMLIKVTDTVNMIGIPYPKYDSNDGFQMKLRFKDSNLGGFMEELNAEIYYQYDENRDHLLGTELDFTIPFPIGIVQAEWLNDYAFDFNISQKKPEFDLNTGFKFTLPFSRVSLELILKQGYVQDYGYAQSADAMFGNEYAEFAVPVKLAVIPEWGDIEWRPRLFIDYSWDRNGISHTNEELYGLRLSAGHNISTGRINWKGNFRQGLSADIGQELTYITGNGRLMHKVSGSISGFWAWKYAGIAGRISAATMLKDDFRYVRNNTSIGEYLRGVLDDARIVPSLESSHFIVFNIDVPIRLFATDWRGWGKKIVKKDMPAWFSYVDFELQLSPFIDMAFSQNPKTGLPIQWYTAGFEILLYPAQFRSLVVRASFGFDIGRYWFKLNTDGMTGVSKKEFYLGFGLFY